MNLLLPIAPAVTDYLSVSRIQTHVRCPRQYAMKYIERMPPEFRPVALAFGSAWHETIGEYLERAGKATTPELVEVFAESLDHGLAEDDAPVLFQDDETRDDLVETARQMIEVFRVKVPFPQRVIEIERSFSLELTHPATGEVLPVPVVGSIDAIIENDGIKVVWELKSAKKKWSADQIEFDLQSSTYLSAARALGHENPQVELLITTKSKRPDVQIERLVRHRRDEQELAELTFAVLAAIETGIDYRIRGWQCRSCQWAGSCPP